MCKFTVLFLALVVIAISAVSCDDDCPTCPTPPEEIMSNYDVILGDSEEPFLVYNTKAARVIDFLGLGDISEIYDMAMSGDGSHLLISRDGHDWQGTLIFDLETGDTVKLMPFVANMQVSNTGEYVACNTWGPTYFLDGHTYEIVDSLTNQSGIGSFSPDGSRFCYPSDVSTINIYNLQSHSLDTSFTYLYNTGDTLLIDRVQIDATGRKFYMLTYIYPFGYLLAYSMDLDSTTLTYRLGIPIGDLQITPDGRQIICTDPGHIFIDAPGSGNVIFVDPSTDDIVALVHAPSAGYGRISSYGFMPGFMAITPDSKYTVIACAEGCEAFGMIDNDQHRFVSVIADTTAPYWLWTRYVACRKLPK